MKKSLFTLLILGTIYASSVSAFSSSESGQQVHLWNKNDITEVSRPHRAPSRNQFPKILFYCEDSGELEFTSVVNMMDVVVNIYDSEDQLLVNEVFEISLCDSKIISLRNFPNGIYTIKVSDGNSLYEYFLEIM